MMHTYAHRYTHMSAYTHIHTHILAKTFGKEPSTKMPGSGHLARTTIVATCPSQPDVLGLRNQILIPRNRFFFILSHVLVPSGYSLNPQPSTGQAEEETWMS